MIRFVIRGDDFASWLAQDRLVHLARPDQTRALCGVEIKPGTAGAAGEICDRCYTERITIVHWAIQLERYAYKRRLR